MADPSSIVRRSKHLANKADDPVMADKLTSQPAVMDDNLTSQLAVTADKLTSQSAVMAAN